MPFDVQQAAVRVLEVHHGLRRLMAHVAAFDAVEAVVHDDRPGLRPDKLKSGIIDLVGHQAEPGRGDDGPAFIGDAIYHLSR